MTKPCSTPIEIARETMLQINPVLVVDFEVITDYLIDNPELANKRVANGDAPSSKDFIGRSARKYAQGRARKNPSNPATVPDPAVSEVLAAWHPELAKDVEWIKQVHSFSMASENIVGELLERYIAGNIETSGWTLGGLKISDSGPS